MEKNYSLDTMKIQDISIFGWELAIRGARFPMDSESKSDSIFTPEIIIGPKDLDLLYRLRRAGVSHAKWCRFITVQAVLSFPMTYLFQLDTYKVATVSNSRSRSHTFGNRLLTEKDFYCEQPSSFLKDLIIFINSKIILYQELKQNKELELANIERQQALDILPSSFIVERVFQCNYEVLFNIIHQRYHKEKFSKNFWNWFCESFMDACPYLGELIEISNGK